MILAYRVSSSPLPWLALLGLGLACVREGQSATPLEFAKDVLPLLERSCLPCHNATKSEGELNMETPQLMLKGGENGPVIKPNYALESSLYRTAAKLDKPYMPPAENKSKAVPLTSLQLEILRRWIDEGAVGHGKARQVPSWQSMPPTLASVGSVAVTRQGTLAAAARGAQVTLYDLNLKQQAATLPMDAHPDVVSSLAFSPDGQLLATGSFGEVKLWQRQSPVATASQTKLDTGGGVVAFSADGKFMVTSTADTIAKVTSADGKNLIAELRMDRLQADRQAAMELAQNGAEFELTYQKQELQKAEQQKKAFDEENKRAAAEHGDYQKRKAAIDQKVAEARKKQAVLKQALAIAEQAAAAATAARESAEKEVLRATDDSKRAEKTKDQAAPSGKPAAEQAWKNAQTAAVNAVKKREDAARQQTDAETRLKKATTDINEAVKALSEALSETGSAMDAERTVNKAADDAAAGKLALEAAQKSVAAAQIARDQAEMALAAYGKGLPLFPSAFRGVVFSADGMQVISTHEDGCVRAWSATNGMPLWTASFAQEPLGRIERDGEHILFTKHDGSTHSFSLGERWMLVRQLGDGHLADSPLTDRVNALAFSADGRILATGSGDPSRSGEIKLWNVTSGKLIREFPKAHKDAVLSLCFNTRGDQIASGAADRAVRIWDVATGRMLRNLEAHSNHVLAVSFRHDDRRLASAGADNAIRTWNLQTGDVVKTISDFKKEVTGMQYVEHGNLLLASAGDPEVRLLSDEGATTRSSKDITKSFLTAMAATPDGKTEILGTSKGDLLVLDSNGKPAALFAAPPCP